MSEKLSKRMSFILRHHPETVGLTLTSDGWVGLDALVDALGVDRQQVLATVAADSKGRFQVLDGQIRAVQGHTHSSVKRTFFVPDTLPATLFHGTKAGFVPSILADGLKPGQRSHVHLSADLATAQQVAARRAGDSVIFSVSVAALVDAGVTFGVAENGVWLADRVPVSALTLLP